jgi:hypothetical protein
VFNTAELLINQLGLTPGVSHGDSGGLQLLLNRYVEEITHSNGRYQVVTTSTLDQTSRTFNALTVVLAVGSIESPKLLRRSSVFGSLPASVRPPVGRGLTDHPTTADMTTFVTRIGNVSIPRTSHAVSSPRNPVRQSALDGSTGRSAFPSSGGLAQITRRGMRSTQCRYAFHL